MVEIAGAFALSMVMFGSCVAWLVFNEERARAGGAFWVDTPGEVVLESCRVQIAELIDHVAVVRDLRSYPLPDEYREAA